MIIANTIVGIALLAALGLLIRRKWQDVKDDRRTRLLAFKTHLSILKEEIEGLYSLQDIDRAEDLSDQILDFYNAYSDISEAEEKGIELQEILEKKIEKLKVNHRKEASIKTEV